MTEFIVKKESLDNIANAIKTKIGMSNSEQIIFPEEFVNAIESIDSSAGGGGITFEKALSDFAENIFPAESLTLTSESVKSWVFHSSPVSKLFLPNAKVVKNNAFCESNHLISARLGCVKSLGEGVFVGCSSLDKVIIETTEDNDLLELFDCLTRYNTIFSGTMIESYMGYIYVPQSVIDKYHTANAGFEFSIGNDLIVTIEDNLELLAENFPDLIEKYSHT